MWIKTEHFQIVNTYLFGSVKFLDLLVLLIVVDIVTGILKAIKEKRLRSRTAFFGYARKLGIFAAIIVANVIDVVLELKGAIAVTTVLFYIANEGLSILENLSVIGVRVPGVIKDKLHIIDSEENQKK